MFVVVYVFIYTINKKIPYFIFNFFHSKISLYKLLNFLNYPYILVE